MTKEYQTIIEYIKDTIENKEALDANDRLMRTLAYIGNHLYAIEDKGSFLREELYRLKIAFDEHSVSERIYELDDFIFFVKTLEKPMVVKPWKPSE